MGTAYIPHKNGVVYVFETWTEFDPEKGRRVVRHKAIGKLDPVTKEVVPTGKPGRPRRKRVRPATRIPTEEERAYNELVEMIEDLERRMDALQEKMQMMHSIADELSVEEPDIGAMLHSALLYDPDQDPDDNNADPE